ncbi:unnamed protein product [Mytilus edulis]|uniref:Uncharacterized protein n=1 Tax=Mytilus edulis TaxID=6550 RepID=A0A8S3RAW7_MYTED|nr:unnamed protein product [Mytilus edulis]
MRTALQDGNSALHQAVSTSKTELVKLITNSGIDVNVRNKVGSTALHAATEERNTEAVKVLLRNDIDYRMHDMDGWTALHRGAWIGEVEIVKLIIDKSNNINVRAKDGSTALHLAANHGQPQIVDLLIGKGIAVNLQDKLGRTAIHYGVQFEKAEIVYLFIEHGVKLNLQDKDGDTVLHIAARISNLNPKSIVSTLVADFLKHNCDPSIRNFVGKKPIALTGDEKVKDLIKDYENKNALHGLPFEVRKLDKNSAKVFSQILEEESYPHFESRVMLAGEQDTGKTTIARYLVGKQPTKIRMSTDGIELYNGLSYMDYERNIWLGGKQDFSLEEIIISRSLLKEDETQDKAPMNQFVFDRPIDHTHKQNTNTQYSGRPLEAQFLTKTVQVDEVDSQRLGIFAEIRELFAPTPLIQHLVIDDQIFVNAKDKDDPEMQKIKDVIISESENQPTWGESLPKCFIL